MHPQESKKAGGRVGMDILRGAAKDYGFVLFGGITAEEQPVTQL